MPPCIYEPSAEFVEKSYLTDYRRYVNKKHNLTLLTYQDLHAFSVNRPNDFWMSLWEYLPIKASAQPTRGVNESIPIDQLPQFYEGCRLNYAENLLSRTGSGVAVKALNEEMLDSPEETTWNQLREKVRVFTSALKASGFRRGDVMCVIGGSTVKSLALILAVAAVGGIVASFATDAGERVLLDRVGQLKPKLLFAQPIYRYNGKQFDITSRIQGVWDAVEKPSGAQIFSTGRTTPSGWTSFDEFLKRDTGGKLEFEQVPFHTPFVVMFSSGSLSHPVVSHLL